MNYPEHDHIEILSKSEDEIELQSENFRIIHRNIDNEVEYYLTRDLIKEDLYESNGGGMRFSHNEATIDELICLLKFYKKQIQGGIVG